MSTTLLICAMSLVQSCQIVSLSLARTCDNDEIIKKNMERTGLLGVI